MSNNQVVQQRPASAKVRDIQPALEDHCLVVHLAALVILLSAGKVLTALRCREIL